jgi:hypothetical protein
MLLCDLREKLYAVLHSDTEDMQGVTNNRRRHFSRERKKERKGKIGIYDANINNLNAGKWPLAKDLEKEFQSLSLECVK